jgi:hypothetical protein
MIVKNPSTTLHFIADMVPRKSAEGYEYVKAIAFEATTGRVCGALLPTASGYTFNGFQTYSATASAKIVVCMKAVASGQKVACAIRGFVKDVEIASTGSIATAYSTFTVGNSLYFTDTGHIVNGATGISADWTQHTTVQSTAASVFAVTLSSGATETVDVFLIGKWTNYCAAT